AGVAGHLQPENRSEAAKFGAGFGELVGVAGGVEDELGEIAAGAELAVLGTLERGAAGGLGQRVCVVRREAVGRGVGAGDPGGGEEIAVGVQVFLILGLDVAVDVGAAEDDGPGVSFGLYLEYLQLAPGLEVRWIVGQEAVDETVGLFRMGKRGAGLSADVFD